MRWLEAVGVLGALLLWTAHVAVVAGRWHELRDRLERIERALRRERQG